MNEEIMLEIENMARTSFVYSKNKKYRLFIYPVFYTDEYYLVICVENKGWCLYGEWSSAETFNTKNIDYETLKDKFWKILVKYDFVKYDSKEEK